MTQYIGIVNPPVIAHDGDKLDGVSIVAQAPTLGRVIFVSGEAIRITGKVTMTNFTVEIQ